MPGLTASGGLPPVVVRGCGSGCGVVAQAGCPEQDVVGVRPGTHCDDFAGGLLDECRIAGEGIVVEFGEGERDLGQRRAGLGMLLYYGSRGWLTVRPAGRQARPSTYQLGAVFAGLCPQAVPLSTGCPRPA